MSTDDANKKNTIVWKRNQGGDGQSNIPKSGRDLGQNADGDTTSQDNNGGNGITFKRNVDDSSSLSPLDLATTAGVHQGNQSKPESAKETIPSIDDLKAEIEAAFAGKEDPSASKVQTRSDDTVSLDGVSEEPLLPITKKAAVEAPESASNEEPLLPVTKKESAPADAPTEETSFMPPQAAPQSAENLLNKEDAAALSGIDTVAQDNHATLVESLKGEIDAEFEKGTTDEEFQAEKDKTKGVGQTYYSDLSSAMGANEPATMSELIRKSRFEKKEAAILSPKSKKNLIYIGASILLLLITGGIIFALFGARQDPIEFVSEERVSSLVYANQDTGINVTNIESERIKQAIRTVIEKDIPEDTINQIYYVEQTAQGGVRRLGVKDIFDKTDNQTPKLLYDNIENDFTHGVYATDRNYPFIILKALSYDRALEGMKEWEPDMLDDLATYFDLPPEGTDRSLIQDGFEDDLIRNKNVRVARFLPREVDRRGILDFLNLGGGQPADSTNSEGTDVPTTNSGESLNTGSGIDTSNSVEVDQQGNIVEPTEVSLMKKIQAFARNIFAQSSVYAQTPEVTGTGFGNSGDNSNGERICYPIQKSCIDRSTGQTVPYQQGDTTQLCTDVRTSNTPIPSTPQLEGDTLNYSCINTISGGEEIQQGDGLDQLTTTEPVCFNNQTGARLQTPDTTQFCFAPYRCNRLACKLNGLEVSGDRQGEPGVTCGEETPDLVAFDAVLPNGEPMPKICRQFNDILSYQNINDAPVCFDNQSNYLKYKTPNDPQLGFNCIMPQNRSARLCITGQDKVAVRTGNEIFTTDQFCFTPNQNAATNIGVNGQCADLTTNEIQSRLAWVVLELRLIAGIGSLFGLSGQDVSNINQAADYLADVANGNILQIEEARQTALVIQTLEQILDNVDPNLQLPQNGPNGGLNLYGLMRELIDTVKCTLGIANTLQWSTLAQIPQGITIYAGQSIPGVEPVQQALALMGLLDPLSVSGTLDLLTQDAISQFQLANAITVTGILDPETLQLMQTIIDNQDTLYGGDEAIINDYFVVGSGAVDADGNIITGGTIDADGNLVTGGAVSADEQILTLGAYNNSVQNLQVLLYAEGYNISTINGLFDEQTCEAVQQFQIDNELEVADPIACTLSPETLEALNDVIRAEGYLGSGLALNPQGFLEGVGKLEGNFGPGVANFEVNEADADSLREGDIVLMYMFLDEETILIARDQVVIDEIIQRRVLSDIFRQ
ncbi:MAG: peptidoglycan-binding protein [Candidatus Pacebacteria bacterium]|nr:peptidoglycan-binding protein [Candidatus Paceibacterota bacterium]